jgi:hypothetical protein
MEVEGMPVACPRTAFCKDNLESRGSNKIPCKIITAIAVLLLLLATFGASSAKGQAVYGSIGGTVADASGGAVAHAKVTITDTGRNVVYNTETANDGSYKQTHLIIGHYRVQVEMTGFKTENTEVDVAVDEVKTVDLTLQPGDVKQIITVTDEAPLLKTERTDVSTTLSEQQINELPTYGRNFSQLMLLTPGTVQFCWGDTSTENPQGGLAVNVNGQMFVGVNTILDGTDNRDFLYGNMLIVPNLDSVEQMKVTSADYNAEFGQISAAVVTTSTKSGTNDWHGSSFWYRRSDATMARDPFAESTPDPVTGKFIPPTLWNQFGGSIGGPIIKNKLFIFGDYQGTRAHDGGSAEAQVPTAAERGGDFSAWLVGSNPVEIFNPFDASGNVIAPSQRTQFVSMPSGPNANPLCTNPSGCPNMIPSQYISQVSENLLKYIPLPTNPNAPPGVPNYEGGGKDVYHADAVNIRTDYFYSDKLRFFDRYTFTQFYKSAPGLFGGAVGGPQLNQIGYTGTGSTRPQSNSFGFDYTFRPTLLVDFRFGWYKQRINVDPLVNGDFATQAGAVGLNIPSDPTTDNMPHFSIQGPDGFDFGNGLYNNCNCPLIERMQQFQAVSNWTWTIGKHTIKFGPDIHRLQNLRVPSDQHRSGELDFGNDFTEGPSGEGLGVASFLLGDVSSFQRYVSNSLQAGERQWRFFFYGQDTWRITPKLTLNYGLRWEIYRPQTATEKDGGGWPDLQTGEMLVAGENGVPLSGPINTDYKNLAPRLGIAYQVNPKTVVRLGYGRSFDVGMFGTIFGHTITQNLPVLGTEQLTPANVWDQVFNLAVGPPEVNPATVLANQPKGADGNPLYPGGPTATNPAPFRAWVLPFNTHMPTVDSWNATIQRQITPTLSLQAGYVGNKGTHIFVGENNWIDLNTPSPVGFCNGSEVFGPPGTPCLTYDERRPYFGKFGWTAGMQCMCNPGDNHYNSLQMQLEKRFSHGLSILGNYTFSHAKNHDSPDFLYDPSIEYGRPAWQRNHTIVVSTIYQLPFGKGRQYLNNIPTAANYFIGGWQLSNVTTWMSGAGFDATYQECGADNDIGVCFPNVVGPIKYYRNQNDWFQLTTAPLANNGDTSGPWGRPTFGTFGNAGRDSIIGPRWFDSDLSIFKDIPLKEQFIMQFRAEAYNVFNHANLGGPNTCVDCVGTGGGTITSLANNASMRKLQFALRLQF